MAGLFPDQPMHGLADPSVGRVPLWRGPQLDDVHRLAGIHVHVEADTVGHYDGVGGGFVQAR
jgi:hypothetical protein